MKKLALVIAVILISAMGILGCKQEAKADISLIDIISKLPVTNSGVWYNLTDSEWEFTQTFQAITWKGVDLNIGYATEDTLCANIAYQIINLEKLGVNIPILKDIIIDAGWNVGFAKVFNTNEFSQGPTVTLRVKF